jgi:hypothetical protein
VVVKEPKYQTTTNGILVGNRTWCVTIDISQHDGHQVDREDIIPRHSKIRTEQEAWHGGDECSRIREEPRAGDEA